MVGLWMAKAPASYALVNGSGVPFAMQVVLQWLAPHHIHTRTHVLNQVPCFSTEVLG